MKLVPYSVAVMVKDRERAARWYREKLGLKLLLRGEHFTVVGRKNGLAIHLCQYSDFGGKPEPGNSGILFWTGRSLAKTYRALVKRGVKFPVPPKKEAWGSYARFVDPDGNEFWIMPRD